MATSFGFGIREFEKKIRFRAPPPNTYNPDNSKRVAYPKGQDWIMGRPGVHHKTNRLGQKMTQDQREQILLTKWVAPPETQDVLLTRKKGEDPLKTDKRLVKMAPYSPAHQKFEDPTKSSDKKMVPRMGYRYKDEGDKYYKYAFPDYVPDP